MEIATPGRPYVVFLVAANAPCEEMPWHRIGSEKLFLRHRDVGRPFQDCLLPQVDFHPHSRLRMVYSVSSGAF